MSQRSPRAKPPSLLADRDLRQICDLRAVSISVATLGERA
jgi:hypothetical protein